MQADGWLGGESRAPATLSGQFRAPPLQLHCGLDRLDVLVPRSNGLTERSLVRSPRLPLALFRCVSTRFCSVKPRPFQLDDTDAAAEGVLR